MKKEFRKYEAATEAAERWLDEITKGLHDLYYRYHEILKKGDPSHRWERMPSGIDKIQHYSGNRIHISGSSTFRNCTDYESCDMPADLFFASTEEREAILSGLEAKIKEENRVKRAAAKLRTEARERAQYVELKAKFEGN